MQEKIKVIITGSTGMVGEGVLIECLTDPSVEEVLVINRKPCGYDHPKLREIIHADFLHLDPVQHELAGYNACFFCMGVSSVGMNEEDYSKVTYDLTLSFAKVLVALNRDMVFCYISGAGTDSSASGRVMWARVKGKTENDLRRLPFKGTYSFRPGVLSPTSGQKNKLRLYSYLGFLLPVVRMMFPKYITTLKQLGKAMIHVSLKGYPQPVLEVADIIRASTDHTQRA